MLIYVDKYIFNMVYLIVDKGGNNNGKHNS